MVWGLQPGEVFVLSGPRHYGLQEFMFELARAMSVGNRRIALFTTLGERQVPGKRDAHRLLTNIDIFCDGAGNDLDFVLGQLRYGKPAVAMLEVKRRFLTKSNLDKLRQVSRINKASVFCVVAMAKHERMDAEEAAQRAAERLDDPGDIPEL
jgi:hypothetical protein